MPGNTIEIADIVILGTNLRWPVAVVVYVSLDSFGSFGKHALKLSPA
jgi:hypothetical protein